ncbi:MAG: PBP1A family penicillin-binding protein [Nitrospinae bacterium]|nr:PBP1A family penicillin-binding protein [Nitrospinota bacterium]
MLHFRKSVVVSALVFGAICGGMAGYIFAGFSDLPDITKLEQYAPPVATKIFSSDGRLIGELFQEKRELLPYDQIPQYAIKAVLATEDARFYRHRGVRVLSLFRALLADLRAGKMVQGGSTITQQLAKTLFLTPEKTLSRKVREMIIALQLELKFTKPELLTMYFNQIYFGAGAYGIESAAQVYFGKHAKEMTLAECAVIGAIPRAPTVYSPANNMARSRERRSFVLGRMLREGYISSAERAAADLDPITLAPAKRTESSPWFLEVVRQELEQQYGSAGLYRDGLEVQTTMDYGMQISAQKAVAEGVKEVEARIKKRKDNPEGLPLQAALIALDPATGEIRAMVGGVDFKQSQFNRALQAKRQPGSSFKPFLYLAALESGMTPATRLIDSPIQLDDPAHPGGWKPINYENRFFGPVSMRFALTHSLNVASVKLFLDVGVQRVINTARKLGITTELHPFPSLVLGGSDATLVEMTSAYSAIANHGILVKPHFIHSVKTRGGVTDETHPTTAEATSAQNAFIMTSMLKSVVESGTGQVAQKVGFPVAAKTGTTSDFTDSWFVGYSPKLSAGVWVGYDIDKTIGEGETGARAAGPIWTNFMREALAGGTPVDFEKPDGIVEIEIDEKTGLLPDTKCGKTTREFFREDNQPTRSCKTLLDVRR